MVGVLSGRGGGGGGDRAVVGELVPPLLVVFGLAGDGLLGGSGGLGPLVLLFGGHFVDGLLIRYYDMVPKKESGGEMEEKRMNEWLGCCFGDETNGLVRKDKERKRTKGKEGGMKAGKRGR